MEICIHIKSYNCYGGHRAISPIGDFLLKEASDFGDAIKEIFVTIHLASSGPPRRTLEKMHETHHQNRLTLPKIVYRKTKGQMSIDVSSDLESNRVWKSTQQLSLPLFKHALDDVVSALSLMKKRLKTSDVFDVDKFLEHCDKSKKRIPQSNEDFQILIEELNAIDQAKRDAMSPWDKLALDWDDFHPKAREILDDPFFWEGDNYFSPNGNDTGADLLYAYRDWFKKHKNGKPISFFQQLAKKWGYTDIDGMDVATRDEASIGLAFSEIKLRGLCDNHIKDFAMRSISRQRSEAQAATNWPHREERLQALDKIEAKLKQIDS